LYAFTTVVFAMFFALGTLDFMVEENRFRVAITGSLKLVEQGEHAEALNLLDGAIAEAKRDQNVSWIRTLCHHAAIVSRFTENLTAAQHYYEESLASDPENARALYGLATVALDQGRLEIAKQYAKRSHTAILRLDDDDVLKQGYLDLLLKHWPDIAEEPA
jgi:tetratricopeptide (TPR) repeat protein